MSLAQIRRGARAASRRRFVDFGPGPQPLGTAVDLTGTATYYVDSVNGLDTNGGTSTAAPKKTLAALPVLAAGNTIALKCGSTFREAMPMTGSGASGSPITWGQYGTGAAPKIKGSKDYGTALTWTLTSGAVYQAPATALPASSNLVYVDERTPLRKYASLAALQAGSAGGYFADTTNNILYVWMWDGSNPTGHTIEVNGVVSTLANTGTRAFVTAQDIAIMHGSGSNAGFFSASTSAGIILQRCTIGPHFGAGVYVGSPGMIVQDCLVTGCWDAIDYPATSGSGAGITGGTANSTNCIVRRNWVTGCTHGIRPNGMQSVDIHHNFVYLNHVNGIDNFAAGGANTVRVINNTVWHRPDGATPAGHGIDQQASGSGLRSLNNIVFTDFTGTGATNVEAFTLATGTGADTFEDYNLGWVDPASNGVFGKVATTTYSTAATYWAAVDASYGAANNDHSLNADPLFVSLGNLDPRLQPGSPAANAGTPVAGITDGYIGSAPDLGAFESSVNDTPADAVAVMTGLVARWRPDSLHLADAATVTSWMDWVSGRVATGSTGVTYRAGVLNGQPVVRFGGTTGLQCTSVPFATAYTVIAVTQVSTFVTNAGPLGADTGAGTSRLFQLRFSASTTGQFLSFTNSGGNLISETTPATATAWNVLTAVRTTGGTATGELFVNGTTNGAASFAGPTDAAVTRSLTIGASQDAGQFMTGDVAEVLVFDHALSATERQTVHRYVQDRYGITVSDYV